MQDNTHSLQFLYKPTVVDTRKDAMKVIYRLFAAGSLVAEPYVVFYKDSQEVAPNAIIALGTPVENEVFIIDTKLDKELIEKQINDLKADLVAQIGEVGEKEIQDIKEVTNSLDSLREKLTSRIDDLVKTVEVNEVFVGKTDTLVLKKENQVITGEVVISKEGANSKSVDDDNIIVNQNGIYAAVDMNLDKSKLQLITSGYDHNGNVLTDIVKREIDLSEILLEISPSEYNILRLEDDKLYVDGRAKNIKYKKTTVAEALNTIEDKVETLQNLDVNINRKTNVLSVTVGETTKKVNLPGLDLVDRVEYDKANHEILIIFKDGSKAPINMLEVLSTFKFIDTNTIDLSAELGNQGGIRVSGKVKISKDEHNVIKEREDGLFVDADKVTGATMDDVDKAIEGVQKLIKDEENRAERKETELATAIEKEVTRAQNSEKEIATVADAAKADVETLKQSFTVLHEDYTNHVAKHEVEFAKLSDDVATNTSDIANLKTQVGDTKIELSEYKATHNAEFEAVKNSIDVTKAELAGKIDEVKADLTITKDQVDANKNAILNEVSRAQLVEQSLSDRVAVAENSITTLNGGLDTPDSVRFIVKHFIELLEATVEDEIARSTATDEQLATKIKETSDVLDKKIADTNDAAVAGMTSAIEAEVERAKTAESVLQTAIDNHNSVAKEYTDAEINKVSVRVTANEQEITTLKENITKKIENVALVKNSENDLEYNLLVDEKLVGQINIPKDNLLENVSYDPATHILTMAFTVGKDNNQQVVSLNLSDLVDTYLAGNGIALHGNVFSLLYNAEGDEGYLKIDENGVCVNGLNAKFNEKANAADVYNKEEVYTKVEADGKFITEHQSLDEYAKTADVEKVYATKEEINGFANTEAVSGIADTLAEHTAALAIINGNEAEEGSIKKALKDAQEYADSKYVDENEKISQLDNKVDEGLAGKANVADVYTKAEIDANNFLTEHQDLSYLATKESVNAVDEQAKANADAITLLNDIEGREGSVAHTVAVSRIVLEEQIAEKANSADVYTKTEADSKFRSEVRLVGDINSSLVYTLMVDGVACGQINIPKDNFVKSVTYDPSIKALKFVFAIQGESGESSIIVPVGDFVETYLAGMAITIDSDNKISVNRSVVSEDYLVVTDEGIAIVGIDAALGEIRNIIETVIEKVDTNKSHIDEIEKAINECNFLNGASTDSVDVTIAKNAGNSQYDVHASVRVSAENKNMITVKSDGLYAVTPISDAPNNMLQSFNEGLYVSDRASNIKVVYKGVEEDVQSAFNELNETVEEYKNIGSEITEAVEKVNQFQNDINTLKQSDATQNATLTQYQSEIDNIKRANSSQDTLITEQQKDIDGLKTVNEEQAKEIAELKKTTTELTQQIQDMNDTILNLKNMIENMLDLGTYNV